MSFSQEAGYVPTEISTIMLSIMENINTQFGTTYTEESFVGTNFYKYFYALAQKLQENEIKTSEIFLKLQQYLAVTNEAISRPVVTPPGLIEEFLDNDWVASVKPMVEADAGKASICVDVDDGEHAVGSFTITSYANLVSGTDDSVTVGATVFTAQAGAVSEGDATFQAATSNAITAISLAAQINAHATASTLVRAMVDGATVNLRAIKGGTDGNAIALAYTDNDTNVGATKSGTALTGGTDNADFDDDKLAIATIIKDSVVAGVITQGPHSETIVLSNGQSFDFKFFVPNRIEPLLRLTTVLSTNNQSVILSPDDQKALLMANIEANYALGKNFEPQRYFSLSDAPWASSVLLEYSLDGGDTYSSAIYETEFDDLFEVSIENIALVET